MKNRKKEGERESLIKRSGSSMEMFSEALANMSHQFLNYSIAFVLGKHNLMPTFGVENIHLFIFFCLGEIFYSRILMSAVVASRYRAPHNQDQVKTNIKLFKKAKHPSCRSSQELSHCSPWSLWSSALWLWSFSSNQLDFGRSWQTWVWYFSRCLPGSSSGLSGLLITVKSRQIF